MDWEAPPFIAATMVSGHFARVPRYCDKLRQSSGLAAQQPHSGQELVDWLATQARVTTRLVSKLQAELKSSGVDVRFGRGSLLDANTIRVKSDSGQTELVRADHLVLATGSRPDVGGERLRRLVQQ
jgi:pyruvate/2-oxoglutarate dehydrogenase complex dihydrolipoamide dehydrogenase (E3) component